MKKIGVILSILFLIISCNTKKEINISALNGYWEIEKVIAPNGEEKPYKFNAFIDFIKLETNNSGYRAKLKPNFRGTFEGNYVKQFFKISNEKNDSYSIQYNVNNIKWSETLIEVTKTRLITKSEEGITYLYTPFKPITVQ